MPPTTFPTAEEQQENLRQAEETRLRIAALIEEVADHVDELDVLDGWRGIVLRRFFLQWNEHQAPDDRYWYAVGEFLAADSTNRRDGSGFDDGLRAATIRLMIAADKATGDEAESDGELFLKINTFRAMETAHEQIGKELDRIRREA
jgi:hypothetical protein